MFDFKIRFIFIEKQSEGMIISEYPNAVCFLMSVYDTNKDMLFSGGQRIYTWDRNRFSWYVINVAGGSARNYQLNEKNIKYCYIAF